MENDEFELQEYSNLFKAYELAENFVLKNYLHNLSEHQIVPIERSIVNNMDLQEMVRLYKIEQLTYKKDDNISLKLSALYNSIASSGASIIVILDSKGTTTGNVDFYIGVRNNFGRQALATSMDVLKRSLQGNFIGSSFHEIKDSKLSELVNDIFLEESNNVPIITSVSGAARIEKDEKKIENKGIENFIEAMRGIPYTAIFIADALSTDEIIRMRNGYEDLYTSLVPLSKKQLSYNRSNSESMNVNISKSITESITTGVSYSQSHTDSTNHVKGYSSSKGKNVGLSFMLSAGSNNSKSESINEGKVNSDTQQKGINEGNMKGVQEQKGHGKVEGYSEGYNLQIEVSNKKAVDLLDRIDKQLHRINDRENAGIFNCCAYFIAGDKQDSIVAANTYKSLILGDSVENEASVINVWDNNIEKRNMLKKYLKRMVHPCFEIVSNEKSPIINTNGSLVNGTELAVNIGFPLVSVPGVEITEHVPFGRNTMNYNDSLSIELGTMYYMGYTDIQSKVKLNLNSLASHTFVTGSTGAGKTNVVCNMIKELKERKIKFLIVEPAKGEYKNVFGNMDDVYVYGTNPFETDLLRINPFRFPIGIHILEHIERLTEIFNACWPMYAAMPAVLKESIERAYIQAGWDLNTSTNKYSKEGIDLFPEFEDVLREVRYVIRNSEFSDDNQGDYIGALCTRIRSLTNGIYKQMFVNADIDDRSLFDKNVIIDLSRVFSSEIKSLIMGLLIMKLQEYRISNQVGFNDDLKHVTVLEEAHNLLRRTSFEQSSENSNLMGKSVEMISNAIAEMRSYGEGFIVADQAPGLLDLSVIRNTNTKIILRLPEAGDRELVGKAISLNDEQIVELAKLDTGIAAIYHNNWKSAVLCKVNYSESNREKFKFERNRTIYKSNLKNQILEWLFDGQNNKLSESNIEKEICASDFKTETKICLLKLINASRKQQLDILFEKIICNEFFIEFQKAFEDANIFLDEIDTWYQEIKDEILNNNDFLESEHIINKIIVVLTKCIAERSNDKNLEDLLIRLIDYLEGKDGELNDA